MTRDAEPVLDRLLQRDASLWPSGNVSGNRLGWLDVADRMREEADELQRWANGIDAEQVVLIGMGGSSLGPEVLRAAVNSDRLVVLDTTDPATIAAVDTDDALFLVASKSGGTIEVQSLLSYFWQRVPDPSRYIAITDEGTALHGTATEREFAKVFVNPSDIGGRYSVLSYFGLVPAALLGYEVGWLCDQAISADRLEAVDLGLAMAEAATTGRDKLSVLVPEPFSSFGLWVEQLVAESTGKSGRGVIPVPTTTPEKGDDRFEADVALVDPLDLGREFLRWELATAAAGHAMEIDPFDEPNVSESKANTARVLSSLPIGEPGVEMVAANKLTVALQRLVGSGDYVSVQAYVPYGQDGEMEALRRRLTDQLGVAVTAGYGPRFLHSTGQLHKGGANNIIAVQVVPPAPTARVDIPGQPYDFGTLIAAQAAGDLESLQSHGRRVLRCSTANLGELS